MYPLANPPPEPIFGGSRRKLDVVENSRQTRRNPWRSRRVVVLDDLGDLAGPTSGVVELPHRLFWQPKRPARLAGRPEAWQRRHPMLMKLRHAA